ncbi:hypothetical protein VQ574_21545 (plasmid) [Stutzerimonas frequens]|uniref:hypothetical protein n=1 Tax=Stutzerimonas frequens TaxID=2968969 RepID=UPI002DBCD239|nr:hypothetical protein [Stutzerimonas frequens]WRW29312.1 hypothetical protein VQ574_21545 [Stutzerimonas frequens]
MTAAAQAAPHMVIANTLLAQLGGRRFIAMTGAKDLLALSADQEQSMMGGLQFNLPRGLAKDGINRVRITLNCADTYKVEALKVSVRSLSCNVIGSTDNVYWDQLENVFSDLTGLATRI